MVCWYVLLGLLSPRYVASTIAEYRELCQDSSQYYRIPILRYCDISLSLGRYGGNRIANTFAIIDVANKNKEVDMLYLLAILLPPVAVLLCGKPIQALLNLLLTVLGYFPGLIHAILVVNAYKADQRNDRLIRAMNKNQ